MHTVGHILFLEIEELYDDLGGQLAPLAFHLVGLLRMHNWEHFGVVDDSVNFQKLRIKVALDFKVGFQVLLIKGETAFKSIELILGPLEIIQY